MNSEASAEKPTRSIIHKVATQMKEVKDNGGKIVVVGGPAVVHTGCAPILADLIKKDTLINYLLEMLLQPMILKMHSMELLLE